MTGPGPTDEKPRPRRRSPRLMASGAILGLVSVAGVFAGLANRPLRELGAACIFTAVGGAMLFWHGLTGGRRKAWSGSNDDMGGDDGDGDGGGDGGGDSSD